MASWEDELAVLLRELGVTQEESEAHLRPMHTNDASHQQGKLTSQRKDEPSQQVSSTNELFLTPVNENEFDDDAWMQDLRMMRREVESIVSQVVRLMQRGDFDPALKEDVMVVLRALRRRASITQQAASGDAAYLEFAAAMLHFCRLVLRLSEVSTEEL